MNRTGVHVRWERVYFSKFSGPHILAQLLPSSEWLRLSAGVNFSEYGHHKHF